MKAVVRRIDGIAMAGKADSSHWIPMDGPADLGGHDAGARPLELLLIGLGGCSGMDVLSILKKKRVQLDDFEITLEAERAETYPRVFTSIRVVYHFWGADLPLDALKQAVELSETKYCSATAMLRKAAPVESRIEVHPPRTGK